MPASTTITVRVSTHLVSTLDALALRLSAAGGPTGPGGRVTRTAAARLALRRGIAALEDALGDPGRLGAQLTGPSLPDPRTLKNAAEALEQLAALDLNQLDRETIVALGELDSEVVSALGELDAEALRSLGRLDCEALDALAALDACALDALGRLASGPLLDVIDRLEDLA